MDHVDIELSSDEGHIFVYTDSGDLLELRVPSALESVIAAMRERPPSVILLSGASAQDAIVRELEALGHEVTLATSLGDDFRARP